MRPVRLGAALIAAVTMLLPLAMLAGNGPPPGLNGPFEFIDKNSFERHTSLTNIDQALDVFCLAGRTRNVDATVTLNRRVDFDYLSRGTITKASDTKVDADFTTMDLTLTITILRPNAAGGPITIVGPTTITPPCKLDASLRKAGEEDRVGFSCNVGPDFADFALPALIPSPGDNIDDITQAELLETIEDAHFRKKNLKVVVDSGDIVVRHSGTEAPEDLDLALVCDPAGGGNGPPE